MGLFLWTWAVSLNKSIWAADFPFVLLSSCPMVTHSAWLSRNIQSALSLPISRCNKTQQLLLWGTLKGILWGRWESRAEWQPMPQPIFTFSCLRRGWEGGRHRDWGGKGESEGGGSAVHGTAFLSHRMVISTHCKMLIAPSEWLE